MTNAERNPLKWKFTANISSLKINYTMNTVTGVRGIFSLKVYWMLINSTRSKQDISMLEYKYLQCSNISIITRRPEYPSGRCCLLMSITVKCPIILAVNTSSARPHSNRCLNTSLLCCLGFKIYISQNSIIQLSNLQILSSPSRHFRSQGCKVALKLGD